MNEIPSSRAVCNSRLLLGNAVIMPGKTRRHVRDVHDERETLCGVMGYNSRCSFCCVLIILC